MCFRLFSQEPSTQKLLTLCVYQFPLQCVWRRASVVREHVLKFGIVHTFSVCKDGSGSQTICDCLLFKFHQKCRVAQFREQKKKKTKTIYHLNFYSGLQPLGWGPVLGLGPFGTWPQKEEVNGTLIQCDVTDTVRI